MLASGPGSRHLLLSGIITDMSAGYSKEVATAIQGAIILAKLSIVPMLRGYWGNKIGKTHTVLCKVTGRCGSLLVLLILAPRGTGIVSAPVPKKLLLMAAIDDCYTPARGCTATLATLPRPLLMPFPRPTVISPLTSGKRQCSPSLHIRNSLTIL